MELGDVGDGKVYTGENDVPLGADKENGDLDELEDEELEEDDELELEEPLEDEDVYPV